MPPPAPSVCTGVVSSWNTLIPCHASLQLLPEADSVGSQLQDIAGSHDWAPVLCEPLFISSNLPRECL